MIAIAGLWALHPAAALACTCASTGSAREDARAILADSDAAFIGVLKSVRTLDAAAGARAQTADAVLRYRVRRDFKAPLGRFVKVRSDGTTCGLPTRVGRKVALGIYGRPRHWKSGLCSLMRPRALRKVAAEGAAERLSGTAARDVAC